MFTRVFTKLLVTFVCVVSASMTFPASLQLTHNADVAALLQSGRYADCQKGMPSSISGRVTWTCASTETIPMICCLTSSESNN